MFLKAQQNPLLPSKDAAQEIVCGMLHWLIRPPEWRRGQTSAQPTDKVTSVDTRTSQKDNLH